MAGRNELILEILPDGTLKLSNEGGFDAALHASAEAIIKETEKIMGTKPVVKRKQGSLNPQAQAKPQQHHKH